MITAPWQPLAAWSVLITPPTEEPITLEEAKLRAGLDWPTTDPPDPRDQLMRDHIAAARSQVERDTGLALLTQTRDVLFVTLPSGLVALPMQALPLQAVVSVTPIDPGAVYALPSGAYSAVREVPPEFAGVPAGVARVTVGWLDAADLRLRAPLLVQAVGLLCAHFATAGRDAVVTGTTAETVPLAYEEAIASYRLIWVA